MSTTRTRIQALDKKLKEERDFWINTLSREVGESSLKPDFDGPQRYEPKKQVIEFALPEEAVRKLIKLTGNSPLLVYAALLAALKVCLHRYNGSNSIAVGSPPRLKPEAPEPPPNLLAIVSQVDEQTRFQELLMNVRRNLIEAYARQSYPFERLAGDLGLNMPSNRCPLFDIVASLRGLHGDFPDLRNGLTMSFAASQENISCSLEYDGALFLRESIERFANHFVNVLHSGLERLDAPVCDLQMVAGDERHQLLVEWNATRRDYSRRCVHELFEAQAASTPHRTALMFEGQETTYAELNMRANQLARHLRRLGVGPEALVGICMEQSTEMIIAMLGVLKAGAAYVPLDPAYPRDRLAFILGDSRVLVLLTQSRLLGGLPEHNAHAECLDTGWEKIGRYSGDNLEATATEQNAAYVIYTSGSTGRPKGVVVQHGGVCNMVEAQIRAFHVRRDSRVFQFASFSFDASVSEIFMALASGAALHLASRDVVTSIESLFQLLRDQAITTITLPPSLLGSSDEEDMPALETIIVAGESCSGETLARWSAGRHFINAYGPTEATVCASLIECSGSYREGPPIGRPISNTKIYLLDARLQPVPVGVPGEIHIAGVGLARGYLNRPDLTAEKFIPNPFGGDSGARLYKTGDVARYLPDGNIAFVGRADHQVKLRGYRIELGEIESQLGRHPAVQECLVVAREDVPGEKRLVAYMICKQEDAPPVGEFHDFLRNLLPEYMIPSAFIFLDEFPLTPNGKVDRRALPAPDRARPNLKDPYAAPRDEVEQKLAEIWAQVLNVEQVGIQDNFFELGGHSLLATQVMSRVREHLNVEMPLGKLFESPVLASLAQHIRAERQAKPDSPSDRVLPVARDGDMPLSFAQKRLWFIDQFEPGSAVYNIPAAVRLTGVLDRAALERSINEIVRRHEALRASFPSMGGRAVQIIRPFVIIDMPLIDLSLLPPSRRQSEAQRLTTEEAISPFDLSQGPLLRAKLLRLGENDHVALFTMHHMISDGWSMGVLIRELSVLYESFMLGKPSPLAELPIQYADFAKWQQDYLQGGALEEQLQYWKRQLADLPTLNLPTDRPRPETQSFAAARQTLLLPPALSEEVRKICRQEDATIFTALLAAFQILLHRYSEQNDIVVGTDMANRNRIEIEGLIGFFVNHLVLRSRIDVNATFSEFLGSVREATLGGHAHQDVPFDLLVKHLNPKRRMGHTPLFQVLFVMQNIPMTTLTLPGLVLSSLGAEEESTKYELSVFVNESEQGILTTWQYRKDLFEASTIERMATHFEMLLRSITANPISRVGQLEMHTNAEKEAMAKKRLVRQESKFNKLKSIKREAVRLSPEELVKTGYLSESQHLPLVLSPSTPDADLLSWASLNRSLIDSHLLKHGALLFRGFDIHSISSFELFAQAVCLSLYDRYGDLPREGQGGKVYGSTPYPSDEAILFHNESSHLHCWPMKILFHCVKAAAVGGNTPLVDCRLVYRGLSEELRQRFKQKGLMYVRNFGQGLDVSWQDFYRTESREEVERQCRESGTQWEWKDDGGLRTRKIQKAVRVHPRTGEEVFFNQVQLHHVSCLREGVRGAMESVFGEEEMPRSVYWGDGARIEEWVMKEVGRAYEGAAVRFGWEEGDVILVDNMLVAHGRDPFEGERKIVVSMGEMREENE